MAEAVATYYLTTDERGHEIFHCLYCATAGEEHHATDPALFASHMEQRHDGRLIEGPAPAPAPVVEPAAPAPETASASASPPETPVPEDQPLPAEGA